MILALLLILVPWLAAADTATLSWGAPVGGGPVIEYEVHRKLEPCAGTAPYRHIATVPGLGYVDDKAPSNAVVAYRIAGRNASGIGAWTACQQIGTAVAVPAAPTNFQIGGVAGAQRGIGPSYWMPVSQFDAAVTAGGIRGHFWVGSATGPLQEAKNRGLQMDVELGAHAGGNGTATPALVTSRLTDLKNAGFADTIRYVWLIDEPDTHPAGTWDMNLMAQLTAAARAVHPWPVCVLVRAHSSTYSRAVPFFADTISDCIGWDPYLAAWMPQSQTWIRDEASRLRGDIGAKPLIGIMQAGLIGWASDATHPAKRPSITELTQMGIAALEGGATEVGLWFEDDWPLQPIEPWISIATAVTAWREWTSQQAFALRRPRAPSSVNQVPIESVRRP